MRKKSSRQQPASGRGKPNPKPVEAVCGQSYRDSVPEEQMPATEGTPIRQHHQLAGIK